MNACILTIGDELLNGHTVDTNATWLGQELNQVGVRIVLKLSVEDQESDIISALDYAYTRASLVIITGGLGPTHDDITKQTLVTYFQDELRYDPSTYAHITEYLASRNRTPTEKHKVQSMMPARAQLLTNQYGTAPGMWYDRDGRYLLSMPGVPHEMKDIMTNQGLHLISALSIGHEIHHEVICTAGIGETLLVDQISDIVADMPDWLSIAYLPSSAQVRVRLTARAQRIDHDLIQDYKDQIVNRLSDHVFGYNSDTLEGAICRIATERGLKVATVESCTGGAIAAQLVTYPGASAYFKGALVTYADSWKERYAYVSSDTLMIHGAVSAETVKEMVRGILYNTLVDVVVAVSGIAGPTGGTPTKPVGTIWIATGRPYRLSTLRLELSMSRTLNIYKATQVALYELYKMLQH